jgi:hypothetical protein
MMDTADPHYSDHYVAFLDILGFSELTRLADQDPTWRAFLRGSIKTLNETMPRQIERTGFRFTQFSDSIVMSAAMTSEGLSIVVQGCQMLAHNLLTRGVLLRGGIAAGKLHHDDQMLFGAGLIDAYEFERRGGPPHIALSGPVATALDPQQLPKGAPSLVVDDPWDLTPMLHTLAEFELYDGVPRVGGVILDRQAVHLAAMIDQRATDMSLPPAVRAKWRWQQDYWNRSISTVGLLARSESRSDWQDYADNADQAAARRTEQFNKDHPPPSSSL